MDKPGEKQTTFEKIRIDVLQGGGYVISAYGKNDDDYGPTGPTPVAAFSTKHNLIAWITDNLTLNDYGAKE
jgi:hypothetical protein